MIWLSSTWVCLIYQTRARSHTFSIQADTSCAHSQERENDFHNLQSSDSPVAGSLSNLPELAWTTVARTPTLVALFAVDLNCVLQQHCTVPGPVRPHQQQAQTEKGVKSAAWCCAVCSSEPSSNCRRGCIVMQTSIRCSRPAWCSSGHCSTTLNLELIPISWGTASPSGESTNAWLHIAAQFTTDMSFRTHQATIMQQTGTLGQLSVHNAVRCACVAHSKMSPQTRRVLV